MADTEAKWYILHTYSGYENKVANDIMKVVENRNLQNVIEEVYLPVEMTKQTKENGKEVEVEEKLFPSYVFVKMIITNESWYICRNTRGVTGFVGPGSQPTPLSEEEVKNLGIIEKETSISFDAGDRVSIKSRLRASRASLRALISSTAPLTSMYPCSEDPPRLHLSFQLSPRSDAYAQTNFKFFMEDKKSWHRRLQDL